MANQTLPGPWHIETTPEHGHVIFSPARPDLGLGPIVVSRWTGLHADGLQASAAPELLEALNYLLEQTVDQDLDYGIELTEGETDARQKALAAIAKATGAAPPVSPDDGQPWECPRCGNTDQDGGDACVDCHEPIATDLAEACEGFACAGCGRPEGECSADPCPDVIADREA